MPNKAKSKFSKFYFPGIISLALLPLICVVYLFTDRIVPKYGRLELLTFTKQELSKFNNGIIKPVDMVDINTYRKYHNILFTGNPGHDVEEHARLKVLLKQLNDRTDLVNGIRITLGAHSKYNDMVNALNDYYQNDEKLDGFMMVDNQMFIYQPGIIKSQSVNMVPCGGIRFLPLPSQPLTFSQQLQQLSRFWPSAIIFVAMIFFAISKRRYFFLWGSTSSTNNRTLIQP